LTLECDEPLSTVAFNFNLRRYIEVSSHPASSTDPDELTPIVTLSGYMDNNLPAPIIVTAGDSLVVKLRSDIRYTRDGFMVGRCWLTISRPELKARLLSALETTM